VAWNIINASYPQILRGLLGQTTAGLLYVAPTYTVPGAQVDPSEDPEQRMVGLTLRRFELNNRAAAANVGIGFRWANRYWKAGQLVAADTPDFTDDTTDAQDLPTGTADFALMNTTSGDGWCVHSDRQFSWVSVLVRTADVGASADVTADYTNTAGTGWTALTQGGENFEPTTSSLIQVAGANYTVNTERMHVFTPPNDWGKIATGGLNGIPEGRYALRFMCAVATTAAVASVVEVGSMVAVESLATLSVYANDQSTFSDPYADAVVAFFSIANPGNRVYAEVTTGV
jgi:hypothetical protein